MYISSLIIEVTRKCNMKCEHCMRGGAQSKNIDYKYIDILLQQVDSIGGVVFTGGEPSLNTDAIEYFLRVCKRRNIDISYFLIATNGKNIKEEFVIACLKLYSYCSDKEVCTVVLSNDIYHKPFNTNYELLKGLSFFTKRNKNDNAQYNLIKEGRAKYLGTRDLYEHEIIDEDDFQNNEIYLNVNGDIINGCDWSYVSQPKHKLCHVSELNEFYQTLSVTA